MGPLDAYARYRRWVREKSKELSNNLGGTDEEFEEAQAALDKYGGFMLPMEAVGGVMGALRQYIASNMGNISFPVRGYLHPEEASKEATKLASGMGGETIIPVLPNRSPSSTKTLHKMVDKSFRVYDSDHIEDYALRHTTGLTSPFPSSVKLPNGDSVFYAPNAFVSVIK